MTDEVKEELKSLDKAINDKLTNNTDIREMNIDIPEYLHLVSPDDNGNDETETPQFEPVEVEAAMPEADDFDMEAFDKYLSAEVVLPKGDQMLLGKVVTRKRDLDDNRIGKAHSNPIFDTRLYQVQFSDGHVEEYNANIIAQNLYSQIDKQGNQFTLLDAIIDYEKDEAVAIPPEQRFIIENNGNIHKRPTTKGWRLCVQWKDGSTSWEALKDLKESFPIEIAEFALSRGLQDEAAFLWWIYDYLRRKNRIVKGMKSCFRQKTHQYGIRVPQTVQEAYEIDRETRTDYWHQVILKEMKNNAKAFQFLAPEESIPVGSTWIPCHMVFDVKMDLTRKARFVAGGHWTDPPSQLTYSTVVSLDSIRIAFLIAALNDL